MLSSELSEKVHEYLSGKSSLSELENWVVPRLPVFYALPSYAITQLVDEIEFGLAEISAGAISEKEFKSSLKEFMTSWVLFVTYPETDAVTQSEFSDKLHKQTFVYSEFTMSWSPQLQSVYISP